MARLEKVLRCKEDIKMQLVDRIFSEGGQPLTMEFYIGEHHPSIEVESELTATKNYLYKYTFLTVSPCLNILEGEKKALGLRMGPCSDILVGLVNRRALGDSDFEMSNKQFNQESTVTEPVVLVSNYGYSFVQGTNSEFVGVNFTNNSMVYLIYNSTANTLSIVNAEMCAKLNVPVSPDAEWHFMAMIVGANNSLKLVNEVPKAILANH
jgi:hypothetical protein